MTTKTRLISWYYLVVFAVVLCQFVFSHSQSYAAKKPKWIMKPPEDRQYIYVVGVATGAPSLQEGRRLAISNAVSEIVQFFGYKSSVKFNEKRTELYTKVMDQFEAISKGATIKGSFLDEWYFEEDKEKGTYDVFVLVRFPREEINREKARQKRKEAEKAYLSQKSLKEAKDAEAKGDIITSFAQYIQALRLSRDIEGGEVIHSQAVSSLNSLASRLQIQEVSGNNQQGELSKGLEKPLVIRVVLKGTTGETPIKDLPILFEFVQSSGVLTPRTRTNENGEASTQVTKIESLSDENMVKVALDVDQILPITSDLAEEDLRTLSSIITLLGEKEVVFLFGSYVTKKDLRVIILVQEKNLEEDMWESIVGNELSSRLLEAGYKIIGDQDIGKTNMERLKFAIQKDKLFSLRHEYSRLADLIVTGSVSTRPGGQNPYGMISSLADAYIKVISLKDGEVIAQTNKIGIAGFGLTEEQAGINALKRVSTLIADAIIEQMGRSQVEE
ncbi:MAG: hypothetical protein QME40_06900 [bacterium]|nr:hypothetical protein [bacterium]